MYIRCLGGKVFLVNGGDTLLPFLDRDISLALEDGMRTIGIEVFMPA
ncbi:MAG: NAD-binding protein [Dehalococcoidia bacterium]|nr:NAD-binding protein [Dehalococcoidia bacterium]